MSSHLAESEPLAKVTTFNQQVKFHFLHTKRKLHPLWSSAYLFNIHAYVSLFSDSYNQQKGNHQFTSTTNLQSAMKQYLLCEEVQLSLSSLSGAQVQIMSSGQIQHTPSTAPNTKQINMLIESPSFRGKYI